MPLNRVGFDQGEPVAALAALGLAAVQPHPVDARGALLAHAAHDSLLER